MKQNTGYTEAVFTFLQSLEEELNQHELLVENLPEKDEKRLHYMSKSAELKLRIEHVASFIAHHKIMKE